MRRKEFIERVVALTLTITFAFIFGLSLGIAQKQAITAIFETPEGFNMEFDENYFTKMDELFKLKENEKKNENEDKSSEKGDYVASKIGKKYYPFNCKAAQGLSEKNKIYFKSAADAEKAGYSLSERCK